jgi:capsular exopolysaccharide synthesis family protein
MSLTSIVRLLLRHWLLIGLVTLLVGAGTYAVSTTRQRLYTATASEYFSVNATDSAAELAQGSNYLQDQMASFGQLATSPAVLNPVIDDLGLPMTVKQLGRTVRVSTPRSTVVMQISVANPDPATAAAIANAVGSQLSNAVDTVGPKLPNGKSLVTVQSIQTALPPTVASSPNTRRNTALGLLIGLLLASSAVLARARLDNRVRTPEVLAEVTGEPLLGTIRRDHNLANRQLVVLRDVVSRSAEDIRHLRASVERLAHGRPGYAVAVTSSIRKEGRSTIAANLAAALGEAGRRCVLVDADLRQPQVAGITGTDADSGLLAALRDPASLLGHLQHVPHGKFDVLTAGGVHDNPSELIASPALAAALAELRRRYEFVVMDTPAVLAAADAESLRSEVDGALMVVDASLVRRPQLTEALQTAEVAGLQVVGVVLNEVAPEDLPPSTGYASSGRRALPAGGRPSTSRSSRSGATVQWDTPPAA